MMDSTSVQPKAEVIDMKRKFEELSAKLGPTPTRITAMKVSLDQLNALNLDSSSHRRGAQTQTLSKQKQLLANLKPLFPLEKNNSAAGTKAPEAKSAAASTQPVAKVPAAKLPPAAAAKATAVKAPVTVAPQATVAKTTVTVAAPEEQSAKAAAKKRKTGLAKAEQAYKVSKASDRSEEIARDVKSLLNKICPDNLQKITDQLAMIQLDTADELLKVIQIIFRKALDEPHYCETYANMVTALQSRYPEFPADNDEDMPQTFLRVLLNTCQVEFENLPATLDPPEAEKEKMYEDEIQEFRIVQKKRMLSNMKFIGHLFLRQLLSVRVMGAIIHDLIGSTDPLPLEHQVECACELIQHIGQTIEEMPNGSVLMSQFMVRLQELKNAVGSNGKKAFCMRIQFQVQDLLDVRTNSWAKKQFKEQAKTKDEIRKEAEAEQAAQAKNSPKNQWQGAQQWPAQQQWNQQQQQQWSAQQQWNQTQQWNQQKQQQWNQQQQQQQQWNQPQRTPVQQQQQWNQQQQQQWNQQQQWQCQQQQGWQTQQAAGARNHKKGMMY